jgi:hypothetical protein
MNLPLKMTMMKMMKRLQVLTRNIFIIET